MEKIPGVSLDIVVDALTVEQLGHVASQLKSILAQLHSVKSSKLLGSVSEGPYRNEFFHHMWAFSSVRDSRSLPRDAGNLHGTIYRVRVRVTESYHTIHAW
jgi:hypothetical protein